MSVRDFALRISVPRRPLLEFSQQNREGRLAGQEDLPRESGRGRLNFKLAIVEAAYGLLVYGNAVRGGARRTPSSSLL